MRALPSSLKVLLGRGLLALALLFSQQQAALHWLSHAVEATQAKAGKTAPAADHCDECLAFAGIGSAPPSAAGALPLATAQHALIAPRQRAVSPALLRLAFHSRAPPILG
jgi:hypothetical protein